MEDNIGFYACGIPTRMHFPSHEQKQAFLEKVLRIADQRLGEHDANERLLRRKRHRLPQRRNGVVDIAAFVQELSFDLVEIGPIGLGSDQRVDQGHGNLHAGLAVGGDGPRILGGNRFVVWRITVEGRLGVIEKAVELGLHQIVPHLQRRRILDLVIGALLGEQAELRDTLWGQGMRLEVGVDALHADQLRVHEFQRFEQALRRLLGCVQKSDGGLVGGGLLGLAVGEDHAHRGIGAAEGCAHAELPEIARAGGGAGRHGGKPEELEHQGRGLRPRDMVPQPREMAAGHMAALVRDHADDLIGRL